MSENLNVSQLPKHLLAQEPHDETIEITVGESERDAFVLEVHQLPKLLFVDDLDD